MKSDIEKITGGKQLTWKQYMKKKAEYEEQQKNAERNADGDVLRSGVCKCGHKSFRHRIENHVLIRVCPNPACRDEKII